MMTEEFLTCAVAGGIAGAALIGTLGVALYLLDKGARATVLQQREDTGQWVKTRLDLDRVILTQRLDAAHERRDADEKATWDAAINAALGILRRPEGRSKAIAEIKGLLSVEKKPKTDVQK